MNLFAPILAKAGKALSLSENEVTMARAALAAHDMAPGDAGEAAAILAHRRRREELAEALDVAESVVVHWQSVIAAEEAKASEAAAVEETRSIEREAKGAAEKRVRDIFALQAKLATLRDEHVAHIEVVASYNASRGTRPYIADAEERVRQIPARTTPAVFEEREMWVDADGNQPTHMRCNPNGEMVPAEHRTFAKQRAQVQVTAERFEPAKMPERLADVIRLVDLAGRPL